MISVHLPSKKKQSREGSKSTPQNRTQRISWNQWTFSYQKTIFQTCYIFRISQNWLMVTFVGPPHHFRS